MAKLTLRFVHSKSCFARFCRMRMYGNVCACHARNDASVLCENINCVFAVSECCHSKIFYQIADTFATICPHKRCPKGHYWSKVWYVGTFR